LQVQWEKGYVIRPWLEPRESEFEEQHLPGVALVLQIWIEVDVQIFQ
jgi:hypothetical protein